MSIIRDLWQCAFSPRLYKIFEINSNRVIDKSYEPYNLEKWGDQVIVTFSTMWSVRFYAIPLFLTYLYRRNSPLSDVSVASKFMFGAGVILIASFVARGYSRASNETYKKFVKVLEEAKSRLNYETKQELQKYDFEFYAWPIEYKAVTKPRRSEERPPVRARRCGNKDRLFAVPCKIASYITAHAIALPLIYPGCIRYLNWMISGTLSQGRIDLLKQGAERFKVKTIDENEIDAIFIDRRRESANGKFLVVTCEGNCGFYEAGIIITPINKGYSVLGWNHPGFGNSTGAPYPDQEENGIDCVIQFAINKLGFADHQIIIYGWSIGGFTATFAAINYPNIHSLILDATFDDLLPLAVSRMPPLIDNLVRNVIREYFNLNIVEQLNRFDGRVLIIRRTEDEIICAPTMSLSCNRGNHLLVKLLTRRYPHIFSEGSECSVLLARYMAVPKSVAKRTIFEEIGGIKETECSRLIAADLSTNGGIVSYPSTLGETIDSPMTKQRLTLFLAMKYMEDQSSQHCAPLGEELFHAAWDPLSTLDSRNT